jgi:hypothetical protein
MVQSRDAWATFGVTKSSCLSTISAANWLFLITRFILFPDRVRDQAGDVKAPE